MEWGEWEWEWGSDVRGWEREKKGKGKGRGGRASVREGSIDVAGGVEELTQRLLRLCHCPQNGEGRRWSRQVGTWVGGEEGKVREMDAEACMGVEVSRGECT